MGLFALKISSFGKTKQRNKEIDEKLRYALKSDDGK
jgi:hypothetical protein